MEEDLQHLDLIDKYINNQLSPAERQEFERLLIEDRAFANELKLYKALYSGIEEKSEAELKSRLQGYYEEYEKEQEKPKGVVRYLVVSLSVAASLVLGFFLFFYEPPVTPGPGDIVKKTDDTTKLKSPEVPGPIQDKRDQVAGTDESEKEIKREEDRSAEPRDLPDQTLAFGGLKPVPPSSILTATYPSRLEYTFDGKSLVLFGDPLVPMLRLKVLKVQDKYVLSLKGEFYELPLRQSRTALISTTRQYNTGQEIEESISVRVQNIKASASRYSDFSATISGEDVPPTYLFDQSGDKPKIVFDGKLDPSKLEIYRIEQADGEICFMLYDGRLFELNREAGSATPLFEKSILENRTTRLFNERKVVEKKVHSAN